jgi:hypothetical protein
MSSAALLACAVSIFTLSASAQKGSAVLSAPVEPGSTVTFIWLPDEDSQFRNPITFHVVPAGDSRLHSADLRAGEDWNAWVDAAEMGRVVERLRWFNVKWAETHRAAALKDLEAKLAPDTLEIVVESSAGTARSTTRQAACDQLSQIDTALTSPRVLWLFQLFRVNRGCIVQGFDRTRVPTQ